MIISIATSRVFRLLLFSWIIMPLQGWSQKYVSITIDDVPYSQLHVDEGNRVRLLAAIDSMKLPVAIFINENRVYRSSSLESSMMLFNKWIESPNVTLGNHGYWHVRYSNVGLDSFKNDVIKGDSITKSLAASVHKPERYYRFPYGDLGKDKEEHLAAENFLKRQNYILTPWTVHSNDWLVTELYEYYKKNGRNADASRIAEAFIKVTMEYFDYIESVVAKLGKAHAKQIYMMHDNLLNADNFPRLVAELRKKGYNFITLDEAMRDPMYRQQDHYTKHHDISWVYRWIENEDERRKLMRAAPSTEAFREELEGVKTRP